MATPSGALPDTQAAYAAMVQYLANSGIGATLADYGGVRTQADTNTILTDRQNDYNADVAAGRVSPDTTLQRYRPISPYGSSFHNYGAAFDLAITSRPAGMSYDDALAFAGAHAPVLGLRWGGHFTNPDPPHFELAIPLSQARAKYAAMTGGKQSSSILQSVLPEVSSLSQFLPSLTPTDSTGNDAVDYGLDVATDAGNDLLGLDSLPDVSQVDLSGDSTDDSGEAAAEMSLPPDSTHTLMIAGGVALALAIVYALRQRFG